MKESQRKAEETKHLEWLRGLKEGDQAALNASRYHAPEILTIGRVTPTQLVVSPGSARERRFDRKTGRERGSSSYSQLRPVTPAILDAIDREALTSWLSNLGYSIGRSDGAKLTLTTLRAMKKAFDESSV